MPQRDEINFNYTKTFTLYTLYSVLLIRVHERVSTHMCVVEIKNAYKNLGEILTGKRPLRSAKSDGDNIKIDFKKTVSE
jgi:hypothetical protein